MKNGDMPAMPMVTLTEESQYSGMKYVEARSTYLGLTKREQFAMAAMQSLIGVYWSDVDGYDSAQEMLKCLSQSAVEHADALLAELESTK